MTKSSESEVDAFMRRFWSIIVVCFVLLMVPLGIYAFYMDRRLDVFEDALSYRPPHENAGVATESAHDLQTLDPSHGQIVYVPAYSHVYHQDGKPHLLTVTLSVRNTSRQQAIVLSSVRYYDTSGKELKSYLESSLEISALETVEFLVEREDFTGGSGANFLVEWTANQSVSEPIIEAIMIDTSGQQGISFARTGRVIEERIPASESHGMNSESSDDEN